MPAVVARTLAFVLLAGAAVAIARPPREAAPPPELEIAYASFAGRIEASPDAPAAVVLATPDGEVVLLPNRFDVLVAGLGGREVEIEGLLLTIGTRPLLWVEAIHWRARPEEPARTLVPRRGRQIPI
jgi:hypothetical protein